MEAGKRTLQSGNKYDQYFPHAQNIEHVQAWFPKLSDDTLPAIVHRTLTTNPQTEKIAPLLKGKSLAETVSNIDWFIRTHIQYAKDKPGQEQIKSPAYLWAHRTEGGDCDCYAVFAGTILKNLGIPFKWRVTQYPKALPQWQHIYIIVPKSGKLNEANNHGDGSYFVLDPVAPRPNYEVPYLKNFDFHMETDFNKIDSLDGIINGFGIGEVHSWDNSHPDDGKFSTPDDKPNVGDTVDNILDIGQKGFETGFNILNMFKGNKGGDVAIEDKPQNNTMMYVMIGGGVLLVSLLFMMAGRGMKGLDGIEDVGEEIPNTQDVDFEEIPEPVALS